MEKKWKYVFMIAQMSIEIKNALAFISFHFIWQNKTVNCLVFVQMIGFASIDAL